MLARIRRVGPLLEPGRGLAIAARLAPPRRAAAAATRRPRPAAASRTAATRPASRSGQSRVVDHLEEAIGQLRLDAGAGRPRWPADPLRRRQGRARSAIRRRVGRPRPPAPRSPRLRPSSPGSGETAPRRGIGRLAEADEAGKRELGPARPPGAQDHGDRAGSGRHGLRLRIEQVDRPAGLDRPLRRGAPRAPQRLGARVLRRRRPDQDRPGRNAGCGLAPDLDARRARPQRGCSLGKTKRRSSGSNRSPAVSTPQGARRPATRRPARRASPARAAGTAAPS